MSVTIVLLAPYAFMAWAGQLNIHIVPLDWSAQYHISNDNGCVGDYHRV